MTVPTTDNKVSYIGDGVTTAFPFSKIFYANSHIKVVEVNIVTGVETLKALTTHYTVAGAGNPGGGTITAVTAPPNTVKWVIYREVPLTQEQDYEDNDPLPAADLERGYDLGMMADQQLAEVDSRSLKFPVGDSTSISAEIPPSVTRANKVMAFDGIGKPIASNQTLAVIESAGTSADAAAASAASAAASETDAQEHALTASRWAKQTGATVVDADTGVDSLEYSAKEYAIGTTVPAGSSKFWAEDAADSAAAAIAAVGAVKVSANDTTAAVLLSKLLAGTGITLTENNDGGNETITITVNNGFRTGDVKLTYQISAEAGWIMANDGSIGSPSSGATTRADNDTLPLYTLLYNAIPDAWAPVAGGRGASAAADFAADKSLTISRALGRVLALAGAGAGLTSRVLGSYLGTETETPTTSTMANHRHTSTMWNGAGSGRTDSIPNVMSVGGTVAGTWIGASFEGGGQPFNIMQPTSFLNATIKL